MVDKIKRLEELENRFSINDYDGIVGDKYIYKPGKIPILISAPHSVKEVTFNNIKFPDTLTGGIALLMNELTDCYTIVKSYNDGIDPNHTNIGSDDGYKEKIIDIISSENIKLLIDLHGLREDRETDVDIVTHYGMTIGHDKNILQNLEEYLKSNDIKHFSEDKYYFAKSEKVIVHKIWNILKIPAIELEINWHYRNFLEKENLIKIVNGLKDFIKNYKKI